MSTPALVTPDEICRAKFSRWFGSFATLRAADGKLITFPDVRLNELQRRIDAAVEYCELHKEPCRIIILKPRKEGATTVCAAKTYHLLRSGQTQALCIGSKSDITQTAWDMIRTLADNDAFSEWGNKLQRFGASAEAGARATWSNGSELWPQTAGDPRAGQSKTPTVILADEVAHWGRDGAAANASDTMLALLNSIRDVPGTYVFVSSTANGVGNWYHRTHDGAVTLEERKAGKRGNGWIKVFLPWHQSQWNKRAVTGLECAEIDRTMTPAEERGCETWGWSYEQIAWRRDTIKAKCDGDEGKFNQEFPEDEQSAFLTSGRPVFNQDGLIRLQRLVEKATPFYGNLHQMPSGFHFEPDPNGSVTLWEKPEFGRSYVLSLDTMRGEQSEGSRDADCHSAWVIRAAYLDANKVFHNARAVARISHPCRWDAQPLAEAVFQLSKYYGGCIIVPEINKGLDVLVLLKSMGANLYRRQRHDQQNAGKVIMTLGWETTEQTRPLIVSALTNALREQDFDLECPNAVKELRTFVRDSRGKATAQGGCHDDDVLALGIGLATIGLATPYNPPAPIVQSYQLPRTQGRAEQALGAACS